MRSTALSLPELHTRAIDRARRLTTWQARERMQRCTAGVCRCPRSHMMHRGTPGSDTAVCSIEDCGVARRSEGRAEATTGRERFFLTWPCAALRHIDESVRAWRHGKHEAKSEAVGRLRSSAAARHVGREFLNAVHSHCRGTVVGHGACERSRCCGSKKDKDKVMGGGEGGREAEAGAGEAASRPARLPSPVSRPVSPPCWDPPWVWGGRQACARSRRCLARWPGQLPIPSIIASVGFTHAHQARCELPRV